LHPQTALLLPSDTPPKSSTLKRLLLFFDRVVLPDPEDRAVVNEGEVKEVFGRTTFYMSVRGPYPRVEGYEEGLRALLDETRVLRAREIVQVAPRRATPDLAIAYLKAQALGLAQAPLLRAAIPDYSPQTPVRALFPGDFVIVGGALSPSGIRSRYAFDEIGPPAHIPALDQEWFVLAQLRLGRILKYMSLAENRGALPVADDDASTAIQLTVAGAGFGQYQQPDDLASIVMSSDPQLAARLDDALEGLGWNDLIRLRAALRPAIEPLRKELHKLAGTLTRVGGGSFRDYQRALVQVRTQYDDLVNAERRALSEFEVGALLKGALPGLLASSTLVSAPVSWPALAALVFGGGVAAGAALSGEIKKYFVARADARAHPLFLMTATLERVQAILRAVKWPS